MPDYVITFTSEARGDLTYYPAHQRRTITQGIAVQLAHQPSHETKNRKPLRSNPLGPWELRVGIYRVFYEVDEAEQRVVIVAVGHKEHNVLYVRGKEVML